MPKGLNIMTTNKIVRNIVIVIFVLVSMSLTACGNSNYSLTSADQGNATSFYNKAACVSHVGNNVNAAVNCVTH